MHYCTNALARSFAVGRCLHAAGHARRDENRASPLGTWLAATHPQLVREAGRVLLQWASVGPLLLFCPLLVVPLRLVTVAAFACVLACWTVLATGMFPYACGLLLILLLPPPVWERLRRAVSTLISGGVRGRPQPPQLVAESQADSPPTVGSGGLRRRRRGDEQQEPQPRLSKDSPLASTAASPAAASLSLQFNLYQAGSLQACRLARAFLLPAEWEDVAPFTDVSECDREEQG